MIRINLTLNDGIKVLKEDGVISICSELGHYRKMGCAEKFIYYPSVVDVTQKLEFEIRVREIIRELERLEGRL